MHLDKDGYSSDDAQGNKEGCPHVDAVQNLVSWQTKDTQHLSEEHRKDGEDDAIDESCDEPNHNDPPLWSILFDHTPQRYL